MGKKNKKKTGKTKHSPQKESAMEILNELSSATTDSDGGEPPPFSPETISQALIKFASERDRNVPLTMEGLALLSKGLSLLYDDCVNMKRVIAMRLLQAQKDPRPRYFDLIPRLPLLTTRWSIMITTFNQICRLCQPPKEFATTGNERFEFQEYILMRIHVSYLIEYVENTALFAEILKELLIYWDEFKHVYNTSEFREDIGKFWDMARELKRGDNTGAETKNAGHSNQSKSDSMTEPLRIPRLIRPLSVHWAPALLDAIQNSQKCLGKDTPLDCQECDEENTETLKDVNLRLKQILARHEPAATRFLARTSELDRAGSPPEENELAEEEIDWDFHFDAIQPYNIQATASAQPESYKDVKARILDVMDAVEPPQSFATSVMTFRGNAIMHVQNQLSHSEPVSNSFLENMIRFAVGSEAFVKEFSAKPDEPRWKSSRFFGAHLAEQDAYLFSLDMADSDGVVGFLDALQDRVLHYETFSRLHNPDLYDMTWLSESLSKILPSVTLTGEVYR